MQWHGGAPRGCQDRIGYLDGRRRPQRRGKSTLLNVVSGIKRAAAGRVVLNSCIGHRIAYLPQQSALDRSFPIQVLDLVLLGAWERTHSLRRVSNTDRQRAHAALGAVGLTGLEARPIGSLSAGQLQRTLFARLLMQDAQLLLLDEPFSIAMDSRTTQDLLEVLKSWHREGRTVVAVLHDIEQGARSFHSRPPPGSPMRGLRPHPHSADRGESCAGPRHGSRMGLKVPLERARVN